MRFDFKIFAYSKKKKMVFLSPEKLAQLFLWQGVKLSPNHKMIQVLIVVNLFPPQKHSR